MVNSCKFVQFASTSMSLLNAYKLCGFGEISKKE